MHESTSASAWVDVLAQVESALARAEQGAAAREQLFAPGPSPNAAPVSAAGCEAVLRRVAERLSALEVGGARAGRVCGQVEAILHSEEEAVGEWGRRARAASEKLASWAGGAV